VATWYVYVGDKQYGPIDEATLREWIGQGRLLEEHLVWTDGMSDWVRAGSLENLFRGDGEAPPPVAGFAILPPPLTGTGGETPNRDITSRARALLKGRWGLPIAFSLVLGVLLSGGGVPYVSPLIALIVSGPFALGGAVFFLTLVRGGKTEMGMLFVGFKNFGNALGACILMSIFIFLWSLLLIIPGLIAALAYSQTFYLMAEDSSLDPLAAIRKSKALMQGHKGKLFCLYFRFFGWALLCMLTLGIGFLWLSPYMAASVAHFHEDLRQAGAGDSGAPVAGPTGIAPMAR